MQPQDTTLKIELHVEYADLVEISSAFLISPQTQKLIKLTNRGIDGIPHLLMGSTSVAFV